MTLPIIKAVPEDFRVSEILDFTLSGTGEHLWCYVEKCNMNTAFVKRRWAKLTGCSSKDIAHSGLKDRHAITQQWLSLPAKYAEKLPQEEVGEKEYWRIVKSQQNQRKLRIGAHRKNAFVLRVRAIAQKDQEIIEKRLKIIAESGFPNHFAAQRFGQNNLQEAVEWVEKNQLPKKREIRARVLSTLRSELFNLQLQARINAGNWQKLLSGDRAVLAGSNSHFLVEVVDDALRVRAKSGDVSAGGWLVGKGELPEAGEASEIRTLALSEYTKEISYLQKHTDAAWRAFCVRASEFTWQWEDEKVLQLSFTLPRGSYATALLDCLLMDYQDGS